MLNRKCILSDISPSATLIASCYNFNLDLVMKLINVINIKTN